MNNYIISTKLVLLACIVLIMSGCASSMSLLYEKPSFETMNKGKICVVVDDQRPSEEGSSDPTRVGTVRNTLSLIHI